MAKFVRKRESKKRFSVSLPESLIERVEALQRRADAVDIELDVAGAVSDALRRLCNLAEAEIATAEAERGGADSGADYVDSVSSGGDSDSADVDGFRSSSRSRFSDSGSGA